MKKTKQKQKKILFYLMETIVLEYEDSFFNQEIFDFSEDDKKFPKSFQCEDWKSEKVFQILNLKRMI